MICSCTPNKYKSILSIYTLFLLFSFIGFSYADDNNKTNTKEEIEKKQIANEIYNKYQYIAKSLNITNFSEVGRNDPDKIIVTSQSGVYKVRYVPTSVLDITLDYNNKTKAVTAVSLKSRILDTPEKIESYKNNFYILSKIIDPKLNKLSFDNIYNNLDVKKTITEPKYLISYINNNFLFEIDAYARKTQLFTLKIREKNKTDKENIDLTKDLRSLYFDNLSKLNIYKASSIYPKFSIASIKSKKVFFFSSQNISMDLLLETGFMGINPVTGTIVYENPKSSTSKKDDFTESALILVSITDSKLSVSNAKSLIEELNIKEAITNPKYYKEIATKNKVYTLGYDNNKLYLSVNIRNADYDKKAKLESLTKQLYNTAISDFSLIDKVKLIDSQSLSTSLLASQNTVLIQPSSFLTFRIYFDNDTDTVSRINIVMPRDMLDKNSEVQKNNAIIATKIMNPNISYQEALNIYTYLKNAYGVTETRIINDLRYKRCTYKDETLVFSKADDSMMDRSSTNISNNSTYSNPNLIYEPESTVNTSGKRTLIVKSQPLCY